MNTIVEDASLSVSAWQREPRAALPSIETLFPALVIPADTPAHAAAWLDHLDNEIADRAVVQYGTLSDEARLAAASWQLSRADGDLHFFLSHYIRLLFGQAEARRAHAPLPPQTWTVADWAPGAMS